MEDDIVFETHAVEIPNPGVPCVDPLAPGVTCVDVPISYEKGYIESGYASQPKYAHFGDAGLDLRAYFPDNSFAWIQPGQSTMLRTGIHMALPTGTVGLIFPRSGLGSHGLVLKNLVGVIDSGYRGEIKLPVWNTGDTKFLIRNGDRIAQMIIMPYYAGVFTYQEELPDTDRSSDGFGSTGI